MEKNSIKEKLIESEKKGLNFPLLDISTEDKVKMFLIRK